MDTNVNKDMANMMSHFLKGISFRSGIGAKVTHMRLYKSPSEIQLLRDVWAVSAKAHTWAIQMTHPLTSESFIRAITSFFLEREFATHAYPPIVASGMHGGVLHYHNDNDVLRSKDMILMDVGGQRFGYCADISRSWPVSCKFTETQRMVYTAVLNVQESVLAFAQQWPTQHITVGDLNDQARRAMREQMSVLGFDEEDESQFFLHPVSHALGMDVHDAHNLPDAMHVIKEGYAFTIEPGLYFTDAETIPEAFRNINIRVEDDCIAIGDTVECPTMTQAPRTVSEIENVCGKANMPRAVQSDRV